MLTNAYGKPVYHVALSDEEMAEIIALIKDEAVSEVLLEGIQKKLMHRRRQLKRKIRNEQTLEHTGS